MKDIQAKVIAEILKERDRQDKKFPNQTHPPVDWLSILMEEVGELAKEINEWFFFDDPAAEERYYKELVQTAAVSVGMLEDYLRRKSTKPSVDVEDD